LPEFQINQNNPPAGMLHANDDHVAPFIAVASDGAFVVTWTRGAELCIDTTTPGPCEVRARWFDSAGNLGPEATIPALASRTSILPVAAATGGGFLFVWADKLSAGPDTDDYAIVARKF